MAQRILDHFYPTYAEAVQVVADLTALGVPASDINVIDSESDARLPRDVADDTAQNPAGTGATLGAVIGGGIGALAGVGAITVSLLDPLVQAGWLVPTVTLAGVGAVTGAIVGAVTRLGVTNRKAHIIAAGLTRGKHLVVVRVEDAHAAKVDAVLRQPRATSAAPEPAFDMEPVDDTRSAGQVAADLRREERTVQYKSE